MSETLVGDLKKWHLRLNFGPTEQERHNFLTLRLPWGEDGLVVEKHNREQRHMPLTMNKSFLNQWKETQLLHDIRSIFILQRTWRSFYQSLKSIQSIKKKKQKSNNDKKPTQHLWWFRETFRRWTHILLAFPGKLTHIAVKNKMKAISPTRKSYWSLEDWRTFLNIKRRKSFKYEASNVCKFG